MSAPSHVFLLPGWQNSGPLHWQSLWQAAHGYTRVEQHDWQRPLRGDWCARLEEVVVNHSARLTTTAAHSVAVASQPAAASVSAPSTLDSTADSAANNIQPLLKSELLEQDLLGLQPNLPLKKTPSIVLVAHSLGCHLVAAWAAASRHTSAVRGVLLVAPPDVTRGDLPPDIHSWRTPVLARLPFPAICAVSDNDPFASHAAGRAMAAAWGARCVEVGARGHINGDSGLGDWPAGHALVTELVTQPANLPNNATSGVHRPPT